MLERTIPFVKPGHIDVAENIFFDLEYKLGRGTFDRLITPVQIYPVRGLMEEIYAHIKPFPTFKPTIEGYLRQGLVLGAYSGEDIVSRVRAIVGPTCSELAKKDFPDTLRAKYGRGSWQKSIETGESLQNAIHAPEDVEEAEYQIALFLKYLGKHYKSLSALK